jgi:signal transduction histidine kinase
MLFKILQELFHNILKHAGAEMARVSISREGDGVRVVVEDDGVGFEADESRSRKGETDGFGLFSIRERLDHLGGGFEIESSPGHGTRVVVTVPLLE